MKFHNFFDIDLSFPGLLRSTLPSGRYGFRETRLDWLAKLNPGFQALPRSDKVIELFEFHFASGQSWIPAMNKPALKRFDVKAQFDERGVDVTFDMARFVGLPGGDPVGELNALAEFVESWQPYYLDHPGTRVQIYNMGRKGRIRLIGDAPEEEKTITSRLQSDVAASAPLQAWLDECGARLRRLGPHSWMNWSAETVFGCVNDPAWKTALAKPSAPKP